MAKQTIDILEGYLEAVSQNSNFAKNYYFAKWASLSQGQGLRAKREMKNA